MSFRSYIDSYLNQTLEITQTISRDEIERAAELLMSLKSRGGRLFILGVGGSAANASHAVNDFRKISGIESYAPTDNAAELTARTNDEGWDTTFIEWLKISRLSSNDAVMILSVGGGSQNTSQNIVKALNFAKSRDAKILGIVSRNGGFTREIADVCIMIPVVDETRITPHAEGWQGIVWHLLVNAIKGDN